MSPYDLSNEVVLNEYGWKCRTDSTYHGFTKPQLIDVIRCLEHNWAGEIKANKVLQKRLEKVTDYLRGEGYSTEEINHIIAVYGENI